jgi:hypothetical protein
MSQRSNKMKEQFDIGHKLFEELKFIITNGNVGTRAHASEYGGKLFNGIVEVKERQSEMKEIISKQLNEYNSAAKEELKKMNEKMLSGISYLAMKTEKTKEICC